MLEFLEDAAVELELAALREEELQRLEELRSRASEQVGEEEGRDDDGERDPVPAEDREAVLRDPPDEPADRQGAGALLRRIERDLVQRAGRKAYRDGTHRLIAPAQTLARVRPHMPMMGITEPTLADEATTP